MRGLLGVAAAGAAMLVLVLGGTASGVGPAPLDTWVPSGGQLGGPSVNATVVDGSTAYIGGAFAYVGPETGSFVSLDTTNGALRTPWPVVGGEVDAVAADGSGGWFVGGAFSSIGDRHVENLAHIAADGTLDTAWAGNADGAVHALVVSGSTLYAGGAFFSVNDAAALRSNVAAFDVATGAVTAFDPVVAADEPGDSDVFALELSGTTLSVGGGFTSVGGQPRHDLGAVSTVTGAATAWSPDVDGLVYALAAAPGGTVYAGGDFATVNGGLQRPYAAAFDAAGTATAWDPELNGEVHALALSGSTVYVGGDFAGGLAAVDATSGGPTGWDPGLAIAGSVHALVVDGSAVYAGGSFQSVAGNVGRDNLAVFGTAIPAEPAAFAPVIGGDVRALALAGTTVAAGGLFTSAGGSTAPNLEPVRRENVAAIDLTTGRPTGWHASSGIARALALAGGKLIVGGDGVHSFSLVTGDPGPSPPVFGGVYTLAANGPIVYVGGQFRPTEGGALAAFNANGDGSPLPWGPAVSADGSVHALDVIGGTIYVGGNFTSIGGVPRTNLAAVDTSGAVLPWDPKADFTVEALTHSGSTIYAGGGFSTVNGGLARKGAAAFEAGGTGIATAWNPDVGYVQTFAHTASTLYVGGYFSLAAVSLANGAVLGDWQPSPDNWVFGLAAAPQGVVAVGQFTELGFTPRTPPPQPPEFGGSYRSGMALLPALPDAPTISVRPGDQTATVSIQPPAYTGNAAIASYTASATPGGPTVTAPAGPVTLTGLTNGTSYTISVAATTSVGTGPAALATVAPHPPPGAPTGVSAVAGNGQAIVTFSPPASNGGEAIASYTVTASPGGQAATGAGSPITVTGLRNGETYTFTVTAATSAGSGPASAPSAPVTPTEGGREEEPTPPVEPRPDVPDPPAITTPRPPPPHHA